MCRRYSRIFGFGLAVVVSILGSAAQAEWPERPVTLVVPYPAGGSTDVVARYLTKELSSKLNKSFVVENRAGASGAIGAASVARAEPDGYTFLFGTTAQLASAQFLGMDKNMDPAKSFASVILVGQAPLAVMTNAEFAPTSLKQLLDYARSNPGNLNYATPGVATTSHVAGEWLNHLEKIKLVHVPYRGSGPATNDLVAGHIKLALDTSVSYLPHIRSGKLRALAVMSDKPFSGLPGVPTMKELGVDMSIVLLFGIAAPAGTPQDIIKKFNAELQQVLQRPETKEYMLKFGTEVVGGSPEDFDKFLVNERKLWQEMVKTTGVQSESK